MICFWIRITLTPFLVICNQLIIMKLGWFFLEEVTESEMENWLHIGIPVFLAQAAVFTLGETRPDLCWVPRPWALWLSEQCHLAIVPNYLALKKTNKLKDGTQTKLENAKEEKRSGSVIIKTKCFSWRELERSLRQTTYSYFPGHSPCVFSGLEVFSKS